MGANGSILSRITAIDEPTRVTKQEPPVLPKDDRERVIDTRVTISPRLTASPFQIDHRSELIREMRADADELDRRAAHMTATALSLRLSADHLDANPPDA